MKPHRNHRTIRKRSMTSDNERTTTSHRIQKLGAFKSRHWKSLGKDTDNAPNIDDGGIRGALLSMHLANLHEILNANHSAIAWGELPCRRCLNPDERIKVNRQILDADVLPPIRRIALAIDDLTALGNIKSCFRPKIYVQLNRGKLSGHLRWNTQNEYARHPT
jgi:hypothetical protein